MKQATMEKLCRIRDLQRNIMELEQQFVKIYGICLNEGMVLCSLKNSERLSSGEIGSLLGLTPSNISKVIASVEKKGLIERFLSKEDKRQMFFSITESGRNLLESIDCEALKMPPMLNGLIQDGGPAAG